MSSQSRFATRLSNSLALVLLHGTLFRREGRGFEYPNELLREFLVADRAYVNASLNVAFETTQMKRVLTAWSTLFVFWFHITKAYSAFCHGYDNHVVLRNSRLFDGRHPTIGFGDSNNPLKCITGVGHVCVLALRDEHPLTPFAIHVAAVALRELDGSALFEVREVGVRG